MAEEAIFVVTVERWVREIGATRVRAKDISEAMLRGTGHAAGGVGIEWKRDSLHVRDAQALSAVASENNT